MKKQDGTPRRNRRMSIDLDRLLLDNSEMKIMFKISSSTLATWRKNNIVVYTEIGRKFYYPFDLLMAMMKSGLKKH